MDAEITTQKEPADREVDSAILSARALYQHDPLLVLLKDKLHLGTLWIVIGGFVLEVFISFIFTSVFQGDLRSIVSLGDSFFPLFLALVTTFSLLIYLLLPASMASVFNTLRTNAVIGPSRQERLGAMSYTRFLERMVTWVDSQWWSIVIVMLGILTFIYTVFVTNPQLLTVPPLWLLVSFVFLFLPALYILSFVLLRVMLLLIFINRLFFLFIIRVRPLHPDGSGGLAALSQIWWMSAALMFVAVLDFVTVPAHFSVPELIAETITYLTLVIALAFGWLALPHRVMVQARNEHLQPITEEYERVLMETKPAANEETAQIVAGTERLSALKQRYELVRDTFPTWPIQIVEMRRLSIVLLLPALISLLPALLSVFTKK
jgi:hypothetical protein